MMDQGIKINLLIYTLVSGIFLVLAWVKFGHHIRSHFSGIKKEEFSINSIMRWAFTSGEFYRRFLVSIGILLLINFAQRPLPGLNTQPLEKIFPDGNLVDIFSAFQQSFSIFAVGLGPFYASCFLVQFLFLAIKKLRPLLFEGGKKRLTVIRVTFAVTILLTLMQALGLMFGFNAQGLLQPGLLFKLSIVASLIGGTFFLIVAAYTITRYGLGHGFGLIFLFSFLKNLLWATTSGSIDGVVLFSFIFLVLAGIAWFATNLTRRVVVATEGSSKIFSLPIRPTWTGIVPVSWASSLVLLPATISQFVQNETLQQVSSWFTASWLSQVARLILITLLCYGYVFILIRPKVILTMLQKHGFSVNTTINQAPENFLGKKATQTALLSSAILFLIGLVATGLMHLFGWPYDFGNLLGASGILIAVGVFFDLTGRLRFFREREAQGPCALVYVAVDEMEATIKKEFLKTKGVSALIEPLRYTWGMPIRTIIDEYRIHVPVEHRDHACSLLSQ